MIFRYTVRKGDLSRIIGGTTVNRPDLLGVITKLIKAKIDVSDNLEGLADGVINLKSLV